MNGTRMRSATARLGVLAIAALLVLAVPGGAEIAHARSRALSVTRFAGPQGSGREAWQIARGSGGMWFTETFGQRIGRISATGAIQEFSNGLTAGGDCGLPQPPAPAGIASARGGVWFTDPGANRIDRADANGAITEFYDAFACPHGLGLGAGPIATGPGGAAWFGETDGPGAVGGFGRIDRAGRISDYRPSYRSRTGVRTRLGQVSGLAFDRRGTLWMTVQGAPPSGLHESGPPYAYIARWAHRRLAIFRRGLASNQAPMRPQLGPDGRIWFAVAYGIGAIDQHGRIVIYHRSRRPTRDIHPSGLTVGSDGRLWFIQPNFVRGNPAGRLVLGAVTTTGHITIYHTTTPASLPWDLAAGPGRTLWITDRGVPGAPPAILRVAL